jgi:RimJ/RimL family protein N-acetyltransferase
MTAVRRATPSDAGSLVELAENVGREGGRWILGTGPWRSIADERRYLRTIDKHPDAAVYVAEDEGVIVGRLSLSRDPHPASRHVADLGLMVAESHRRQGVGTLLLDQAVTWARGSGVGKLELHVFPWNEPALALYTSFGFEREGYRRRHYERGGELVDAILMAYFVTGEGST